MATNTYVALDKVTVSGTSTTSITFNSIPQTYTDLVVVCSGGMISGGANDNKTTFNGDTGTNYSRTYLIGDGFNASSGRTANQNFLTVPYWDSNMSNQTTMHIMNYSNTTTNKTILARNDQAGNAALAYAFLYRSTAAITSLTITKAGTPNFASGSTFSLYGIAAASVGAKATGGVVYSDSQYYYHVFGSTGTFTPLQSLSADVLVVAGGGGGGATNGAGGGAGGIFYATSQSLTATGYTCTVGAGGSGGTAASDSVGTSGTNSTFTGLTAAVGGGYGAKNANAANGGSGGGGNNGSYSAGTSTQTSTGGTGYGNAGGSGATSSSGGGGGSGAAGSASGANNSGGAGGVGTTAFSSWVSATGIGQLVSSTGYIAGGGGGGADSRTSGSTVGAGGYGGGGSGSGGAVGNVTGNGVAGTANTGGGGGGGGWTTGTVSGGAGGSGVVVIRYAK